MNGEVTEMTVAGAAALVRRCRAKSDFGRPAASGAETVTADIGECGAVPESGIMDMTAPLRVVAATPSDAESMAACHLRCFPDQFMAHMGRAYTTAFYRAYIRSRAGLSFVCRNEADGIVGFVVGGDPGIRPAFLARARRRFAGTLLLRMLTDRVLRATMMDEVMRRLDGRPGRMAEAGTGWPAPVIGPFGLLQVIAVLRDYRGSGCASVLVRAFEEGASAAGYGTLGLTVHTDNPRAITFYRKNGWRVVQESPGALFMQRVLQAHTAAARPSRLPRPAGVPERCECCA